MRTPPRLFPKIAYQRQVGRLVADVNRFGDAPPTLAEVNAIRAQLSQHESPKCPRCRQIMRHRGPVRATPSSAPGWIVRCSRCGGLSIPVTRPTRRRRIAMPDVLGRPPAAPRVKRTAGFGTFAAVFHATLLAGLVVSTNSGGRGGPNAPQSDTTMVVIVNEPRVEPLELALPDMAKLVAPANLPIPSAPAVVVPPVAPSDTFPLAGSFTQTFGDALGFDSGEALNSSSRASSDISSEPPQLLVPVSPDYPRALRQSKIEGEVVLSFIVDTTGAVEPATIHIVSSTHPAFEAPARRAVLQSQYRPGRVNGVPARVPSQITVQFKLAKQERGS